MEITGGDSYSGIDRCEVALLKALPALANVIAQCDEKTQKLIDPLRSGVGPP
jgi:hypothetical protein